MRGFTVAACWMLTAVLLAASGQTEARAQRLGGPCFYADYPGKITIIEVRPVPRGRPSALPYQPYRVLFAFSPSVPVPGSLFEPGQAHELTLSGGTPPGPRFLKRYGIRPGAAFGADLHLMRSGTCSPVVFTYHGIDVTDFFELTGKRTHGPRPQ